MKALDRPQLARYAREQIRAAGVILARHYNRGPVCSCGRVEPCSAKLHVVKRRRHFEDLLSMLDAPTMIIQPVVKDVSEAGKWPLSPPWRESAWQCLHQDC